VNSAALFGSPLCSGRAPGSIMNRCAEAAAVAATVPGSGVGDAGLRPPMVPRQASFFPPPVPNPFVQQTTISASRRLQVKARRALRLRQCGAMEEARGEGIWSEEDQS
jgi:hypothetical protein